MTEAATGQGRPRYALVDMARGAAILGVVVYHLSWDLRYYEFVFWPIDTDWRWRLFQKALVASFMLLTGASLVLAHADGIRWRAFWRRFAVLVAAALVVSLSTYLMFPEAFVYFGVLHAIALFSLLGLLFLRLPAWTNALIGLAVIGVGGFFTHELFSPKAWSWIGFYPTPPLTQDLVPVFPWFGFALLGQAAMRAVLASPLNAGLAGIGIQGPVTEVLSRAGRWSLWIYLVHQPLLLAVIVPLAAAQPQPIADRRAEFMSSCRQSCEENGNGAGMCLRYCGCSLEQVEENDLWTLFAEPDPSEAQRREVAAVASLCSAMARADE